MRRKKSTRPRRPETIPAERPSQREVDQCLGAALEAAQVVLETNYRNTRELDIPALVAHVFVTSFPAGTDNDQVAVALVSRRQWVGAEVRASTGGRS